MISEALPLAGLCFFIRKGNVTFRVLMNRNIDKPLLLSGLLAMVMAGVMMVQGQALKTAVTPLGILNLEFALHAGRVEQILDAWRFLNLTALWNNLIAFGFLAAYGYFFSSGVRYWMASRPGLYTRSYPVLLYKGAWLPSVLDAIENIFLLGWLLQFIPSYSPALVFWMVCLKFALAAFYLAIALAGWINNLIRLTKPAL